VKPGELVVVDGADKLRDGAKVEVQTPGSAPHRGGPAPGQQKGGGEAGAKSRG
jgi:multidrug efflux system membrane fusion protein